MIFHLKAVSFHQIREALKKRYISPPYCENTKKRYFSTMKREVKFIEVGNDLYLFFKEAFVMKMRFYNIKDNYVEFLQSYDSKVIDNKHEKRPYIGIVLTIGDIKYYAPLTSPKPKHFLMKNSVDFRKIEGGKLGAININNMIPVVDEALIPIDIQKVKDVAYRRLLQNQYNAIKQDCEKITNSASKLHQIVFEDDSKLTNHQKAIKKRCSNLALLESVFKSFNK